MWAIISLLRKYRTFLVFILLEVISVWLLVTSNYYQNAVFFNSANAYAGNILAISTNVSDYFTLRKKNKELANENAYLRQLLAKKDQVRPKGVYYQVTDSSIINKYEFTVARVVNNSTYRKNNYITIDKGKLDGIKPGMAVISPVGVVGKVRACNNHFSVVISLLHTNMSVSSQIKKNDELGSVKWNGRSPRYAKLLEVPNYVKLKVGDSVVTSSVNSIFPSNIPVGVIENIDTLSKETYYDIDIKLSTNFNSLRYVYVINNVLQKEQQQLEETIEKTDE